MGNFKFDKNERSVSWVKIFEPQIGITITELKKYFVDSKILKIDSETENSFSGEFIKRPVDIQKYGYSRGRTPMTLLDVDQIFNFSIELKDDRYRVILTELGYIDNGVLSDLVSRSIVGNTSTTAKGNVEYYNGEFSFTKKNEIRRNVAPSLEILEKFYSDMMTFKKINNPSSDW